jgi:hypothetical protein
MAMRLSDLAYPNHVQPRVLINRALEDRADISRPDHLASSSWGREKSIFGQRNLLRFLTE